MKLYYLVDTKSQTAYHPFFAQNKDVALRCLSGELRDIREKDLYTAESLWNDSILKEMDLSVESEIYTVVQIDEFRKFFEVSNENKNLTK